jgi:hypothetical protein
MATGTDLALDLATGHAGPCVALAWPRGNAGERDRPDLAGGGGSLPAAVLGVHRQTHGRVQDREMKEGSRRGRGRGRRGVVTFPLPRRTRVRDGGAACGTERMSGEGLRFEV